MQRLTEIVLEKTGQGIFTRPEVACWVGGSADRQFALLRRALARGEVVRIHRGLYCLAVRYMRGKMDPFVLAQRVYGPSYVSLQSALSYHGWIPEAVYSVTSVSMDRSRQFNTPGGVLSFVRVPQRVFYTEVGRTAGGVLMASPLKALADYVYVHSEQWRTLAPAVESLRIDEVVLASLDVSACDALLLNYSSLRVRRFLAGVRKDLHP